MAAAAADCFLFGCVSMLAAADANMTRREEEEEEGQKGEGKKGGEGKEWKEEDSSFGRPFQECHPVKGDGFHLLAKKCAGEGERTNGNRIGSSFVVPATATTSTCLMRRRYFPMAPFLCLSLSLPLSNVVF